MRNGLLASLLVLSAGAAAVRAQGYPPYPAYPGMGGPAWGAPMPYPPSYAPAPPAWPANYQGAPPAPAFQPYGPPPGMNWPALQPFTPPPPPPAAPARPAPPPPPPAKPKPAAEPALPTVKILPEAPHEPVLSPLPAGSRDGHRDGPAPVPAPSPGTPLVCDADSEHLPATSLSHESHPPQHGPRGYRVYGSADYLFWWFRQVNPPPLLSTGPLGAGGSTLLDRPTFDNQQHNGVRATLGTWLNQAQTVGLEGTGLYLGSRNPQFATDGPLLARPFTDATTGAPSAAVLSAPGIQAGSATVQTFSRLFGGEGNLRWQLCRGPVDHSEPCGPRPCDGCCPKPPDPGKGCCYHLDLLTGFRYLQLDDALDIASRTTFAPGVAGLGGATVASADHFGARNQFYGGQVGLAGEVHYGRFFVQSWGKVALGNMHEVANVAGNTQFTGAARAGTLTLPGGLLALPTNSGQFSQNQFAVVPEFGFNTGVRLTSHLRAVVGYTFLYANRVIRGADQIDPVLNVSQRPGLTGTPGALVGPARPLFAFHDTEFWAQGINAGLEFRY